ncbi:hypothetical protein DHEL01_v207348 [Diaporthe helianthi]|uniref:Uncharacterized protein n=1 Tax=Diaporthe helianthi TaxID=158607 RepID=A0A2P5HVH4_DIAHE|nr:hypothetical protein DHEL01_v207348 [Diaporthe helianthi]
MSPAPPPSSPPQPASEIKKILAAAANSTTRSFWIVMPDTDLALTAARSIRAAAQASLRWRSQAFAFRTEAAEFDAP